MFKGLIIKAGTPVIKSDTEKTLRAVLELPYNTQRTIASEVLGEILKAVAEIEKTPGPSSRERDDVIKKHLERATDRRHLALKQGASTHADPSWATAALIESWLMANTGSLGRDAGEHIMRLIMDWGGSVLTDAEFEKLITETASNDAGMEK